MDPNICNYPKWIANCQRSIQWIKSGERAKWADKHYALGTTYKFTPEDDARDILYYEKQIKKYQTALERADK